MRGGPGGRGGRGGGRGDGKGYVKNRYRTILCNVIQCSLVQYSSAAWCAFSMRKIFRSVTFYSLCNNSHYCYAVPLVFNTQMLVKNGSFSSGHRMILLSSNTINLFEVPCTVSTSPPLPFTHQYINVIAYLAQPFDYFRSDQIV